MSDIELATIVAGLVAALRKRYPEIDGPLVWLVVIACAALVCLVFSPTAWREALARAGRIALEAIAGVSVASHIAGKAATVVIDPEGLPPTDDLRDMPTNPGTPISKK